MRLEVEASKQNRHAIKVLELRKDSNFLLSTILWGNVGINVLLTLLSNSVLAGVMAFLFATVLITFLGEFVPQAYVSRHALKAASLRGSSTNGPTPFPNRRLLPSHSSSRPARVEESRKVRTRGKIILARIPGIFND